MPGSRLVDGVYSFVPAFAHNRQPPDKPNPILSHYFRSQNKDVKAVNLGEKVNLTQGSALNLPCKANTFDKAWTEHVQTNIPDKKTFYAEIARVLKPGRRLLFHDILGTSSHDLLCPVPWAQTNSHSHLGTEDEMRMAMEAAGMEITMWDDQTQLALEFLEKVLVKLTASGPPPLGIHLLMCKTARQKLENYVENVMGVLTKK